MHALVSSRRSRAPRLPLLLALLCVGGVGVAFTSPAARSQFWLWAGRPPDTSPAWTGHDSSHVGPILKRVLRVYFQPAASRAMRTRALAAVGGQIVGGVYLPPDGGFYLVRVPDADTPNALEAYAERLRGQPGVDLVALCSRSKPAGR